MRKKLALHPAAEMLPEMSKDEYAALKMDIQQNGQSLPILVTVGGLIVDGRHRYRACWELKCEPKLEVIAEGVDPWTVAVSHNLKRRNLSKRVIAAVGAAIIEERRKSGDVPKVGKPKLGKILPNLGAKLSDQVGEELGISGELIRQHQQLAKENPEAAALVGKGLVKFSAARTATDKAMVGELVGKARVSTVEQINAAAMTGGVLVWRLAKGAINDAMMQMRKAGKIPDRVAEYELAMAERDLDTLIAAFREFKDGQEDLAGTTPIELNLAG